jgi:hypothetical protein
MAFVSCLRAGVYLRQSVPGRPLEDSGLGQLSTAWTGLRPALLVLHMLHMQRRAWLKWERETVTD